MIGSMWFGLCFHSVSAIRLTVTGTSPQGDLHLSLRQQLLNTMWDAVDGTIQASLSPCSYYCQFSISLIGRSALHLYHFPLTSTMPRLAYNYQPAPVFISDRLQISFGAALLLSSLALGCQYTPTCQVLMKGFGRLLFGGSN